MTREEKELAEKVTPSFSMTREEKESVTFSWQAMEDTGSADALPHSDRKASVGSTRVAFSAGT
jgi:hypothetical protein